MKATFEDVGPWQKAIAITLEPEEVEREMERVVARYRQKAVMPGFRKGKVPPDMVRATFREELESDVLSALLPEATEKAVTEHDLRLASPPKYQNLQFRSGEPLRFTAVVDLWPEVDLQGYRGIELDETVFEVDVEMVDSVLQKLREDAARFVPVFRPSGPGDFVEGDLLAVDVSGARLPRAKRQVLRMEAGKANLLPEFHEASLGVEAGTTRVIHIRYPDDFQNQELAGKQRHYRMRVRQIQEKILPELDDAFAGSAGGVDNLEALKSKIALTLEAEERLRARQDTEEALIDRLIQANPFDLPASMVDRSLERAMEKARETQPDLDEEEFRRTYLPFVVRLRKREVILESVARKESIQVTEEELEEEIRRSAPRGVDPGVVRRKLEREGEIDRFRHEVLERKILAFLIEVANVHRILTPRPREPKSNLILP